jgi:hypothetical protein
MSEDMKGIEYIRQIKEFGISKHRLYLRTSIVDHPKVLSVYNEIQLRKKPSMDISLLEAKDLINLIIYMEGKALKFIDTPSYTIQCYAKELGYESFLQSAKKEIHKTDDEIALAISRCEYSVTEHYSNEILVKAIRLNPSLIKKINYPTEELQLEAVKLQPELIKEITQPSTSAMKYAVSIRPFSLCIMDNPPAEVQVEAIKTNPEVLSHLKSVPLEVMLQIVTICPSLYKEFIPQLIKERLRNSRNDGSLSDGERRLYIAAMNSYFYKLYDPKMEKKYGKLGFLNSLTPQVVQPLMPMIRDTFGDEADTFLQTWKVEHTKYADKLHKDLARNSAHRHHEYLDDNFDNYIDDDYEVIDFEKEKEMLREELEKEANWEVEVYDPFTDGYYGENS